MVKAWLAQLPTDLETHPKKRLRRERGPYRPIRLPVRKVLLFQTIRRVPKSKRHGTKKGASAADKLIPFRHSSSPANCSLRPNVSKETTNLIQLIRAPYILTQKLMTKTSPQNGTTFPNYLVSNLQQGEVPVLHNLQLGSQNETVSSSPRHLYLSSHLTTVDLTERQYQQTFRIFGNY